jgi:hypothetical protein
MLIWTWAHVSPFFGPLVCSKQWSYPVFFQVVYQFLKKSLCFLDPPLRMSSHGRVLLVHKFNGVYHGHRLYVPSCTSMTGTALSICPKTKLIWSTSVFLYKICSPTRQLPARARWDGSIRLFASRRESSADANIAEVLADVFRFGVANGCAISQDWYLEGKIAIRCAPKIYETRRMQIKGIKDELVQTAGLHLTKLEASNGLKLCFILPSPSSRPSSVLLILYLISKQKK